jgi:uncharacterized protein involved in type VI secretion and phage assembly
MRFTTWLGCAIIGMVVAGCASVGPSHELVLARSAYAEASQPGMYPAPAPMLEAQRALNAAEYEHTYSPQSVRERHLAYMATRFAQIAMAQGAAETSRAQADTAKYQYTALLENQVKDQQMALRTQQQRACEQAQRDGKTPPQTACAEQPGGTP